MIINKTKNNRGFTLIELMVSISIFMIIMTVAMGSLLVTLDAKKKAEALNFTMDNLNFAMESITRSLRMGTDYYCTRDEISLYGSSPGGKNCDEGVMSKKVVFMPSENFKLPISDIYPRIGFYIYDRGENDYSLQRCSHSCVDIIASNVHIDPNDSGFYVQGAESNDGQPSVYIKLRGFISVKGEEVPFAIQTLVSQRALSL